jgi:hypothetical protein
MHPSTNRDFEKQGLFNFRKYLWSPAFLVWFILLIFLVFCDVVLFFLVLCLVSNVACASGFYIPSIYLGKYRGNCMSVMLGESSVGL